MDLTSSTGLTSALMRLARRAMLQVSWGWTDCLWGRSWGVYSLSLVSLVRVAFCGRTQDHLREALGRTDLPNRL